MKKITKKYTAILMCIIFLLSIASTSSAVTLQQQQEEKNEEPSKESRITSRTVTFYRYGVDGSVNPVEVDIELEEGQDIDDEIAEKCDELLENDVELQNLVLKSNISLGAFVRIKSKGRGFHFKTMLLGKLFFRFILFRLGLPRLFTILNKPLVLCKYKSDPNAKTIFTPILRPNAIPITVNGTHKVAAINFLGFTTWFGRFSFSLFDIIPRAFSGIANLVVCKKFK